ncbi:MAG: hypothetical protein H6741_03220 [Alphaproteobacteria bacterium]|nr:hypothetical protein [Alphaproteobacteria bacterium]
MHDRSEIELRDWLLTAFSPNELRVIVGRLPGGREAVGWLPGDGASPVAFAAALVEVLQRRGLLNAGFFDLLIDARPMREVEIRRLQAAWAGGPEAPRNLQELLPVTFAEDELDDLLSELPDAAEGTVDGEADVFQRAAGRVSRGDEQVLQRLKQARPVRARELERAARGEPVDAEEELSGGVPTVSVALVVDWMAGMGLPSGVLALQSSLAPLGFRLEQAVLHDSGDHDGPDLPEFAARIQDGFSWPVDFSFTSGPLELGELLAKLGPAELLVVILHPLRPEAAQLPPLPVRIHTAVPIQFGGSALFAWPMPERWRSVSSSWPQRDKARWRNTESTWLAIGRDLQPLVEALSAHLPLPAPVPPPEPASSPAPPPEAPRPADSASTESASTESAPEPATPRIEDSPAQLGSQDLDEQRVVAGEADPVRAPSGPGFSAWLEHTPRLGPHARLNPKDGDKLVLGERSPSLVLLDDRPVREDKLDADTQAQVLRQDLDEQRVVAGGSSAVQAPSGQEIPPSPQPIRARPDTEPSPPLDPNDGPKLVLAQRSLSLALLDDRPTAEDKLGFRAFARALAALLAHPDTHPPLTVSVEGAWGSGKSSFLLQLEEELRKELGEDKLVALRFNAWRFEQAEAMWSAFALGLLRAMERDMGWRARARARWTLRWHRAQGSGAWGALLGRVGALLAWVLLALVAVMLPVPVTLTVLELVAGGPVVPEWVSWFGELGLFAFNFAVALAGLGVVGRHLSKLWDNPLSEDLRAATADPGYAERAPFLDQLHADLHFMLESFAAGRRVVVFVDDLDRCEVPRAAELMQAINLLLMDAPRPDERLAPVIFVLAMDREKVAAGFAARHKDVLPYLGATLGHAGAAGVNGLDYGYAFIEKFLQLPFRLPTPDLAGLQGLALRAAAGADLGEAAAQQDYLKLILRPEALEAVLPLVLPALGRNPRRLKQLVNLYALQARIAAGMGMLAVHDEPEKLTKERLARLTALALRWPALIADLHREPELMHTLHNAALLGATEEILAEASERGRRWLGRAELLRFLRGEAQMIGPEDAAYLGDLEVRVVLSATPGRPEA